VPPIAAIEAVVEIEAVASAVIGHDSSPASVTVTARVAYAYARDATVAGTVDIVPFVVVATILEATVGRGGKGGHDQGSGNGGER
jgi:hypothetical protein